MNNFKTLLTAAALLALCSCGESGQTAAPLHSVYTVEAGAGDSDSNRTFAGIVEEHDNISLGFKTAGQIHRIYVKEGDHVRSGQLLADLDASDYRLGVEALQVQYDQLSREAERAKRLYEKKSMSANDYEKLMSGLRQLGVQLQVNKNKLAYTRLYAPSSGVIESVNFSPAEMVDAGTAVFTMLGGGGLEVVCDVPAATYLMRGRIVSVSCTSAHGGEKYPLRLVSIVPKADSNQLYRMRMAFAGGVPSGITSGMNVTVDLALSPEGAEGLCVPTSALFRKDGETCVWVLGADSVVKARKVVTGPDVSGSDVEILSGLSAGENVVRAGVSMLHEGEKVKVIAAPSETNKGGLL